MVLFDDKTQCCGCNACLNVCPQKAISIQEDEDGFVYPSIDSNICVNCGLCRQVCEYRKKEKASATSKSVVYAAKGKNRTLTSKSSSGGVFATLAQIAINDGGIVFGCALELVGGEYVAHHISIEDIKNLWRIQGSKYVQSNIGDAYTRAKKALDIGKFVLFSGTPCQIAGLKSYLKKDYDNLLTVDLVCHGVPNSRLFNSYIKFEESKIGGTISEISFRNKTDFRITIRYSVMGKERIKRIPSSLSSFYNFFLRGDIYRENCYSCKYASPERVSDLTLGDYWGFSAVHPDAKKRRNLKEKDGVSCVLLNTKKGKNFFLKHEDFFECLESDFDKASRFNGQLLRPCKESSKRTRLFELMKEKGYAAVDEFYFNYLGKKKYAYLLWNCVPIGLQKMYCDKRTAYLKQKEYTNKR